MSGEVPEEGQGMVEPSMHLDEKAVAEKRPSGESIAVASADGGGDSEALGDVLKGDVAPQNQATTEKQPTPLTVNSETKVAEGVKSQPETTTAQAEVPQKDAPVATLESAPKYDGSGMHVTWPGKETWKQGDVALTQTDAQLAVDFTVKYLEAKANPSHFQIKGRAEKYIQDYEKIILADGEGADLVKKCTSVLEKARETGDDRTYAEISRGLTDERGVLKSQNDEKS